MSMRRTTTTRNGNFNLKSFKAQIVGVFKTNVINCKNDNINCKNDDRNGMCRCNDGFVFPYVWGVSQNRRKGLENSSVQMILCIIQRKEKYFSLLLCVC